MPGPTTPMNFNIQSVLQNAGEMVGFFDRAREESGAPYPEISINHGPDGTTVDASIDGKMYQTIMGTLQKYAQVVGAYEQEIGRIEQQKRSLNPIVNALTTVAGNLATNDPRLPPVVRALGQSSRDLNPTRQELTDRQLAIEGKKAEVLRGVGSLAEAEQRTEMLAETKRQFNVVQHEKVVAAQQEARGKLREKTEARLERRMDTVRTQWETQIQKDLGKEVPESALRADLRSRGVNDRDKQDDLIAKYKASAQAKREAVKEAAEQKEFARKNSPSYIKHEEEVQARKDVAQEIVDAVHKGDPRKVQSIRQVAGAFGSQKTALMDEIHKLDPNITESELNKIVQTENYYGITGQKGNLELASLGTWVGHAADLKEAAEAIKMLNSKYTNKGLNWLRKEAKSSPELAKLMVALEPAQKEFERFLLGPGRALYESDRKSAAQLINEDMPLDVKIAAIEQMGKTVQKRYNSADQQYRNATTLLAPGGIPLGYAHGYSEQEVEDARKVGVQLPGVEDPAGIK